MESKSSRRDAIALKFEPSLPPLIVPRQLMKLIGDGDPARQDL